MQSFLPNISYKVFALSFALLCGLTIADIPSEIPKCHAADVTCIADTITNILQHYPKGNADFGLGAVDSVQLKNIVISRANANSPVQLNLKFNTLNAYGIENAKVTRTVGFEKDPKKSKFEVYATLPSLRLKGDYEASGRVLLLPITGQGEAQINLTNMKLGLKIKVTESVRDGKRYVTLSKIKSTLEPESLSVNFEGLFNNNKELGDSMNQVINDNWKDIWAELEGGINSAVSDIIRKLMVSVLDSLSYDDFYAD